MTSTHARAKTRIAVAVATLGAALSAVLPAAVAIAQEFRKVEGSPAQEVPAVPFVATAYGFIWIAILTYVFVVARAVTRVRGELDDLRRKVGAATDGPPAARKP